MVTQITDTANTAGICCFTFATKRISGQLVRDGAKKIDFFFLHKFTGHINFYPQCLGSTELLTWSLTQWLVSSIHSISIC